jgi:transposase
VKGYKEDNQNGFLDGQRSGRKRKFTDDQRALVVQVALTDPTKITDTLTKWSPQSIRRHLIEMYELKISVTTIHRILLEHGLVYLKEEESLVSLDPDYEIKKKRIEEAKEEAEADESVAFVCLDEKGPVHTLYHRGKKWMPDYTREAIPKNANKSNGKVVLNAAFEPSTNKFWWYFSERRIGEAFLTLLINMSMDSYWAGKKKVYLLMDNLNSHFTQGVKDFLALHRKFEVLRLPTYSPELNPIERVFADLDYQAIQDHYFQTVDELNIRIEAWIEDRMKQLVADVKAVSSKKNIRKRIKTILKLKPV